MIRFVCACGRQLQAREGDVGKKAKCPSCERAMTVPSDDEADDVPRRQRVHAEAGYDERDRPRSRRDRDDDYDDDRDRPRKRRDEVAAEPSSGKATASLVLGLLAFCTVGLTAIPGIIVGIMALRQIAMS